MPRSTSHLHLPVVVEGYFIEDFQSQTSYLGRQGKGELTTKKAFELRQRLRQKLKAKKESK